MEDCNNKQGRTLSGAPGLKSCNTASEHVSIFCQRTGRPPRMAKSYIQEIRRDRFGCAEGVAAHKAPKDEIFSALLQGKLDTYLSHV